MSDWRNQLELIVNKLRGQLHAKNLDDFEYILSQMRVFDPECNGTLTKFNFEKLLQKLGIFVSTQELRSVYNFCADKQDLVHYNQLFGLLRNNLSGNRIKSVEGAWKYVSKGEQSVSIQTLESLYRADDHPKFSANLKSRELLASQFRVAISRNSADGQNITYEEFVQYYQDLSSTLPNERDEYFCQLVKRTWGMTVLVTEERLEQMENILYEKIRQKSVAVEHEGKATSRAFKFFDLEQTGLVGYEQFLEGLKRFGCVFTDIENQALFDRYSSQNCVNYDLLSKTMTAKGTGVIPNLNPVFELRKQAPYDLFKIIQTYLRNSKFDLHNYLRNETQDSCITRSQLVKAFKLAHVQFQKFQFERIFEYYDQQNEDRINTEEFLAQL